MANYYIGADVDSKMTELAIEKKEKIIRRYRVPTSIPALKEVLGSISGTKFLTFEEGPMALGAVFLPAVSPNAINAFSPIVFHPQTLGRYQKSVISLKTASGKEILDNSR